MWQKFDDFEIGTDFACWGVKTAHHKILGDRRKKSNQKVFFSDGIYLVVCFIPALALWAFVSGVLLCTGRGFNCVSVGFGIPWAFFL